MEPMAIIAVLMKEGTTAFPSVAAVVLWFKLQKMEERLADLVDRYVDLIKENTRHIADSTSALKDLRNNDRS